MYFIVGNFHVRYTFSDIVFSVLVVYCMRQNVFLCLPVSRLQVLHSQRLSATQALGPLTHQEGHILRSLYLYGWDGRDMHACCSKCCLS